MANRKAFTLIEVLISIALMGLILVPLFNVVEMMRNSNDQLLRSLEKSTQITKATKVLFLDIMGSDGNFTLKKDGDMSRFCMEETSNSLYALPLAKVCWLVLKEKNTLVRAEGNIYKLPLSSEDKVEVDMIMPHIEMFDVYREKNKDKVLVVIKQKEKEPISFLVQGIWKPKPPLGPFVRDQNGKIVYNPDGTPKRYPPGTKIDANGRATDKNGRDITQGQSMGNSNRRSQRSRQSSKNKNGQTQRRRGNINGANSQEIPQENGEIRAR